jgi:hypothetical protein
VADPGAQFVVTMTRTDPNVELDDLAQEVSRNAQPTGIGANPATVSRTTVRGQPALVAESPGYDSLSVAFLWREPESGVTVTLTAEVARRGDADRAIENLRVVDEQTWADIASQCTRTMTNGSAPPSTSPTGPDCRPA